MLKSRVPTIVMETSEERCALELFKRLFEEGFYLPLFAWSVTQGLYRLDTMMILDELGMTQPLSVVMAEKIARLRQWALQRTVPAG